MREGGKEGGGRRDVVREGGIYSEGGREGGGREGANAVHNVYTCTTQ